MDNVTKPLVGVILGSKSDLPLAVKISETFTKLGVPYEVTIASAHRTPEDVTCYARKAHSRGLQVIIAVAGLSAALPGCIAAETTLPVLGVPVASGTLGGVDALLSICQMPPGVPVGSVGINAAQNAALLATRILALGHPAFQEALWEWNAAAGTKVRASRDEMEGLPRAGADAFQE
jgi:phosphoribosylaminoimidazole carboxylase PurE protein